MSTLNILKCHGMIDCPWQFESQLKTRFKRKERVRGQWHFSIKIRIQNTRVLKSTMEYKGWLKLFKILGWYLLYTILCQLGKIISSQVKKDVPIWHCRTRLSCLCGLMLLKVLKLFAQLGFFSIRLAFSRLWPVVLCNSCASAVLLDDG